MATMILGTAASAALNHGVNFISNRIFTDTATVGQRALGGKLLEGAAGFLFDGLSGPSRAPDGPRLDNLEIKLPQEGAPIPSVEGFMRVSGRVIWAGDIVETSETQTQGSRMKGRVQRTTYEYICTFAVAIADCRMGPIRHLGRVWADDKLIDLKGGDYEYRFYDGSEAQEPDPAISGHEGHAPAYRGVSYIVFENFNLSDHFNRIPQFSFEVFGPSGEMEDLIRGVDIIPGSTEWGYAPDVVEDEAGDRTRYTNAARHVTASDWTTSMDHLQGVLPQCETAALVVAWFGTDLRAGTCRIEPRVEAKTAKTDRSWTSGGLNRQQATQVTQVDGGPAYGSSPDDQSVIDAIRDLKARGMRTVLYPFVMMDIPKGNTLPDPDDANVTGQPPYPWRGRVRLDTQGASAKAQIDALMGTAGPGDFSGVPGVPPVYSGPAEWGYRRFILHLAALARAAGGVDAFIIGSEMVGLTTATDTPGAYPFVDALTDLAADIRSMLPEAKLSYAADWSEYHSHRSGADVYFHLDPLWASPDIDFVAIDNYLPLADWRAGTDHLDHDPDKGWDSIYDLAYLKANIEGGEYHDWYYASEADRAHQIRTPIQDGAHGEDWVFRQKAIRAWHGNLHRNRPGGIRAAQSTAWLPGSKPVWFTEIGCGAVDLGANQPNKFLDPKSSESTLPHFSRGVRDDFMARQYIRATIEWWRDNGTGVVDPADILVWAWDARPWPEFPAHADTWSDADNWTTGHWLNGRAGAAPVAEMTARWMQTVYGFDQQDFDASRAHGQVDGLMVTDNHSLSEVLRPVGALTGLHVFERAGRIMFQNEATLPRGAAISPDLLVQTEDRPSLTVARASWDEIPHAAVVDYIDVERDYEIGSVRSARPGATDGTELRSRFAVASSRDRMQGQVEAILSRAAQSVEEVRFSVAGDHPIAPGEIIDIPAANGIGKRHRVDDVTRGSACHVRATQLTEAEPSEVRTPPRRTPRPELPSRRVVPIFLDLPPLPMGDADETSGFVAPHAAPWPGGADLYRSRDHQTGFAFVQRIAAPASTGRTVTPLASSAPWRWTEGSVDIVMRRGRPVRRSVRDVLAGLNALAIEHPSGKWEILQFSEAELIAPDTYRIQRLIRGQNGTEDAIPEAATPAGARIVLLDDGLSEIRLAPEDIGVPFYWKIVPAGADPTEPLHAVHTHTFRGLGRRPRAPAHLRARVIGQTLSLSWTRRTRIQGDIWPANGDVPLGEAFERYRITLRADGQSIAVTVSDVPSAQMPLPSISGPLEAEVRQISERHGPGAAARTTLIL